jgi:hypothetical protein
MYSGFAVSGVVDLIGYFTPLPPGTEQVRSVTCQRDAQHLFPCIAALPAISASSLKSQNSG